MSTSWKTATTPRKHNGGVDEAEAISKAQRRTQKKSPAGKRPVPLDVDVIDVSWMDNNVHSMRHNFFNINRWMIDDLREIVSTKRRARLRTARMTRRFANVWSFLAAPRHIVNP
uniref:Uncharacterized protein n=1 Tax=Haptolina brevifila TaxID=156173 RepID=A0A7S2GUL1_9EUKA|mmetsp:Transcript_47137/g.93900  ORF Transcript_47137/g.93900 Transcript_47137/m.93900 type:complete len:114 (+) Transcript_47137:501-842(+)